MREKFTSSSDRHPQQARHRGCSGHTAFSSHVHADEFRAVRRVRRRLSYSCLLLKREIEIYSLQSSVMGENGMIR